MTAEVVSFADAKLAREPHSQGEALCMDCGHRWQAVAPAGLVWMECPSCSLIRGRFRGPHEREGHHWHCNCGGFLFYLSADGPYCPNCGTWQEGWDASPVKPVG